MHSMLHTCEMKGPHSEQRVNKYLPIAWFIFITSRTIGFILIFRFCFCPSICPLPICLQPSRLGFINVHLASLLWSRPLFLLPIINHFPITVFVKIAFIALFQLLGAWAHWGKDWALFSSVCPRMGKTWSQKYRTTTQWVFRIQMDKWVET